MSDRFQLRIVTPARFVLDEEVREVTAPGTAGEFGVLPDHTTFLSSLEIGALRYRTDRAVRAVAIRGGFAEVNRNVMTVLADAAEFADEVDAVRAEHELRDAGTRLTRLSPIEDEYTLVDAERRWAEVRLDIARKQHEQVLAAHT